MGAGYPKGRYYFFIEQFEKLTTHMDKPDDFLRSGDLDFDYRPFRHR